MLGKKCFTKSIVVSILDFETSIGKDVFEF